MGDKPCCFAGSLSLGSGPLPGAGCRIFLHRQTMETMKDLEQPLSPAYKEFGGGGTSELPLRQGPFDMSSCSSTTHGNRREIGTAQARGSSDLQGLAAHTFAAQSRWVCDQRLSQWVAVLGYQIACCFITQQRSCTFMRAKLACLCSSQSSRSW